MNLIIFGPPGAGKGTQSNKIANDFGLKQISTGDLLRNEIKLQTSLGKNVESIINKGKLVSDQIINNRVKLELFSKCKVPNPSLFIKCLLYLGTIFSNSNLKV